jgi:hypothetical protein
MSNQQDNLRKFNTTLTELLLKIGSLVTNEEEKALIERITKRINVAKQIKGEWSILEHTADHIVSYAAQIKGGREKFEKFCAEFDLNITNDKEYNMAVPLIGAMRKSLLTKMEEEDRDDLYQDVRSLLKYSLTYKIGQAS